MLELRKGGVFLEFVCVELELFWAFMWWLARVWWGPWDMCSFRLPHAKISGPQGGVKRLLFGCERQKSELFVLPTVGYGTRLCSFTSRRWLERREKFALLLVLETVPLPFDW
jgi:hypothetical protein